MIRIIRTHSEDPDFLRLVSGLDAELAVRDGDDHLFYNQFNKLDKIKYVVVIYDHDRAIACGSIKEFQKSVLEIKRMYTTPESRGKEIASKVLQELEKWAAELSYEKCILETGINQPEAIRLYKKNGYVLRSNYGQYAGVETSFCFEKILDIHSH